MALVASAMEMIRLRTSNITIHVAETQKVLSYFLVPLKDFTFWLSR